MLRLFNRLAPRQQVALALLAALLLAGALWLLAWRPLAASNEALARRNAASEQTLHSVARLADEYRALQRRGSAAVKPAGGSLAEVVDRTVKAQGMQMSRLQPGSGGDVQVRLDGVPFEAVLRWLHQLEEGERASVRELSVSRAAGPGLVNVSARVARL